MPLPSGRYNLRIVVLARVPDDQTASGEIASTWPEPVAGTQEYFAARDALSGGETIAQGLNNSTGGMRLRIKGQSIAIEAGDRVKKKVTGELFNVSGVWRDDGETFVTVERVVQQTTKQ